MSEYQRFISYMYEYRGGKKSTNCGYARVENRNRLCRLEIHMKTSPQALEEPLRIYGCFHQNGRLFGVLLGQHAPVLDMVNWRFQGDPDNLNASSVPLTQLEGLILSDGSQIAYCSMWNDTVVDPNQMQLYIQEKPEAPITFSPKMDIPDAEEVVPTDEATTDTANAADSPTETANAATAALVDEADTLAEESLPENDISAASASPSAGGSSAGPRISDTLAMADPAPGNGQESHQRYNAGSFDMAKPYGSADATPGPQYSPKSFDAARPQSIDDAAADQQFDSDRPDTTKSQHFDNAAAHQQFGFDRSDTAKPQDFIRAAASPQDNSHGEKAAGQKPLVNADISGHPSLRNANAEKPHGSNTSNAKPCSRNHADKTRPNCPDTGGKVCPDRSGPTDECSANTPEGFSAAEDVSQTPPTTDSFPRVPEGNVADAMLSFQNRAAEHPPKEAALASQQTGSGQSSPWEEVQKTYAQINPFTDDEIKDCVRIELKDLPTLRQHGWRIAGNRFILHSFQKNRHLILGCLKANGRYIFAVPGYYDNQERFMANMFGFPYFKSSDGGPVRYGQKGYWYRLLY